MSGVLSGLILFFTVVSTVALGVVSAYAAVNGVLYAFAYQSRSKVPGPVLVHSHQPASGD